MRIGLIVLCGWILCGWMLLVRPAWAQDALGMSEHIGMRVLRGEPSAPSAGAPERPTPIQPSRDTMKPSEVLELQKEAQQ